MDSSLPGLIRYARVREKELGNFAERKEKVNISRGGLKRFSSRSTPLILIYRAYHEGWKEMSRWKEQPL